MKENTNKRKNSADIIYESGVQLHKKNVLKYLNEEEKSSLENNELYIHDSEYFDITLNCCSISLEDIFAKELVINGLSLEKPKTLFEIFTQLNIFIINLQNEISGGLAFINFDLELAKLLQKLNIKASKEELKLHLKALFQNINFANSRFGNQSPYISFSIGIVEDELSADICELILELLYEGASKNKPYIFPNVQFRVKQGINKNKEDKYNYLYLSSLKTTSLQMNPTYILADTEENITINPLDLHVVGCRSKLLLTKSKTLCGRGRANIGGLSINLVNLAMKSKNLDEFFKILKQKMKTSFDILLKKQNILKENQLQNSPILSQNNLLYPLNANINDILEEASLAIGYIGAWEMAEVFNLDLENSQNFIKEVLAFMFEECATLSSQYNKIVTLIGVSGESLSYYFCQKDKKQAYAKKYQELFKKDFYTNSFHIPVDFKISSSKKLNYEGKQHKFSNGGSISYLELSHVQENLEAFDDLIKIAEKSGVHYLGFNFQKNLCSDCGAQVDEDKCEFCKSSNIIKIRRVSGYLGYLSSFSKGKKLEEKLRLKHTNFQAQDRK